MTEATDNDQPTEEVAPASTYARIGFAILIVLMLGAILFSERFFGAIGTWISEDPEKALERFDQFVAWIGVMSLPLLIAGVFTFRSGFRSVQSGRYPPEGMWLIVKTPIQHGARAVVRGRMMQAAGVLMGIIAIGFPIALWRIVHSIV